MTIEYLWIYIMLLNESTTIISVACPGIREGGGQKSEMLFFLLFNISRGPAQKIADKIIFPTKKVAKYR